MTTETPAKDRNLSIKTVAVEIKVVRVDGHKMTKATFNQLDRMDPYYEEEDGTRYLDPEVVLGWVFIDSDTIALLCTRDGLIGRRFVRRPLDAPSLRSQPWYIQEERHFKWIKENFDQLFIAT